MQRQEHRAGSTLEGAFGKEFLSLTEHSGSLGTEAGRVERNNLGKHSEGEERK